MIKKLDKNPTKKPRLSRNKRMEIVKEEFIKSGGSINCCELADRIGCHRTTITKDIEQIKSLIKKESVEKYGVNLLQEIMQGQNIVRLVMSRSITTKNKDGNPLKHPILNCDEDTLLDRLWKANRIKESDITIMEAWGLKKKVADEIKVSGGIVEAMRDYYREAEKKKKLISKK